MLGLCPNEGQMLAIMRNTHWPPSQLCTPNHMQAITARFSTGQREPHMPKDALLTTGNPIWYVAPMRPVLTMKNPAIEYPIQTQIHACHQLRPVSRDDAAIIHVLMLKESAIQKLTKEMCRHCRRAGSTGFKSWLVRKSCLLVRPGSASVSYLMSKLINRRSLWIALTSLLTQELEDFAGCGEYSS